jgi:PST family polysaccharide transporter
LRDALNTDHLHTDLKGRSVRGGVLTLVSQGTQFLIQTISTIVLARMLTPADFGLVAMVTAVTVLATAFADLGLSEATIQRKDITQDQVSSLFWINVAVGLGLMLLSMAAAPVFAWFYREPRLLNITLLLSLTFLIGGLRVQPDALLKRQMRFSALAMRDVACYALTVPIAITMAWKGAGYWAIVAVPLILNFTQMLFSWLIVRWRPSFPTRGVNVRSMVGFGGKIAASYFIINVNRSIDNVLIGWYWGAAPLGLYSRAYNLLMLPVRQLTTPAGSVAIPTFSRLQSDPERFARYYLRSISLMMWISSAIFGFLFVTAEPLIVLLLGARWREAAPVFQIFVISALGQLLLDSIVWLFVSRGESGRLFKLLMIISPIIICSFAIGLPFGIKGVALSSSLVLVTILPWILKYTFRGTHLTIQRLGQALMYPVSLSLVGVFLAELFLHILNPEKILWEFLVAAMGFAVAYSLSAFISPIREEILSFKGELSELRLPGQPVKPRA